MQTATGGRIGGTKASIFIKKLRSENKIQKATKTRGAGRGKYRN